MGWAKNAYHTCSEALDGATSGANLVIERLDCSLQRAAVIARGSEKSMTTPWEIARAKATGTFALA
jgi:hypothetical protein